MIKLLIGVKGTGKTKTLIEAANNALLESKGYVVCLEKGTKLRSNINYKVRLINTDDDLIEITPKSIRLRKKILNTELRMKEMMRKRRAMEAGK